jgi:DNA-directed RNA polymerase subunit M/transcription elongation factor TFIIS
MSEACEEARKAAIPREMRILVAQRLHAAWERQGCGASAPLAGVQLEAHCFGLRNTGIDVWHARLLPHAKQAEAEKTNYGRQICAIMGALATPRSPVNPRDANPLHFLQDLDEAPLQGRPHEAFLVVQDHEKRRMEDALAAESVREKSAAAFITCRRCKSNEVDTDAKQLRGADEPMTVFACCRGCGNRWTLNG